MLLQTGKGITKTLIKEIEYNYVHDHPFLGPPLHQRTTTMYKQNTHEKYVRNSQNAYQENQVQLTYVRIY